MEFNEIMTAIGSYGFPMVMCLICCWYIKVKDEAHKKEIDKLSESINNNTLVMQKLLDRLGGDDH